LKTGANADFENLNLARLQFRHVPFVLHLSVYWRPLRRSDVIFNRRSDHIGWNRFSVVSDKEKRVGRKSKLAIEDLV